MDIDKYILKRTEDIRSGLVSKEEVTQSLIRAGILDVDGSIVNLIARQTDSKEADNAQAQIYKV